jgi:hypothetical protein
VAASPTARFGRERDVGNGDCRGSLTPFVVGIQLVIVVNDETETRSLRNTAAINAAVIAISGFAERRSDRGTEFAL